MPGSLEARRIAFLTANSGVEQPELEQPWRALEAAGARLAHIAPETGKVQAMTGDVNEADVFTAEVAAVDARADDYDGLVLPGGTTNADSLRLDADAVALVRAFIDAGKPVAAICHAPWTLVEAGVLPGKTLTSYPSLRTDITNAGGTWVDDEVHSCPADGWELVTSRTPDDLPAFNRALERLFAG